MENSTFDILTSKLKNAPQSVLERVIGYIDALVEPNFKPYQLNKKQQELLEEFKQLRIQNIEYLRSKNISPENLEEKGIHPAFGEVTLSQLLAAWVVHDLNHISQISRVMAKQYKAATGPWVDYLKILQQ